METRPEGCFGFIAQLNEWLQRGARNELDHPEGPLPPPIAYTGTPTSICVSADTPDRRHWPWFGAAMLTRTKPHLLEVDAWRPVHDVPNDVSFAPTVLLDFELPYEYPRTGSTLARPPRNQRRPKRSSTRAPDARL